MAITSENKSSDFHRYGSTQFRYAMTYVIITFAVLLFLNIYCSETSQGLFSRSKENSMIARCLLTATNISELDVLNTNTVASAISEMGSLRGTRLVVTDPTGNAVYDSDSSDPLSGKPVPFSEVSRALEGYDVFASDFHDGAIESRAATPIYSYGALMGCVYMMENDANQGKLIQSLQYNILSITVILELTVIFYSLWFSNAFSRRIRRILSSMRIIREGDYSHKVIVGGRDELTVLGEEFNDLTDKLQSSEQKRRQFVSDASHELKTPLASIKLLTDSILQNDMDMDTLREFVGDIGSEADRLNRMSQKLLLLSKTDAMEDSECEIVYMAPAIERVVKMLGAVAESNGVEIIKDLAEDSTVLILEDDLYQITFNLVENGIKYNSKGGKLFITLSREEDTAVLTVSDTGVGIPQDSLSHIFERFYRVDKARSRKSGGSGLGLSIVKNMVERNGGSIAVESTVGQGSTFTVKFPIFDTEEDPHGFS